MSQIDFIVAVTITLGIISFSIYFVTADFSSQMDQVDVLELKQTARIIENSIFN